MFPLSFCVRVFRGEKGSLKLHHLSLLDARPSIPVGSSALFAWRGTERERI